MAEVPSGSDPSDRGDGEIETSETDDGSDGGTGQRADSGGETPAGLEPRSRTIRPESPDPENALFVVLGAIAMLLVIVRLAAIGLGG